MRLTEDLGYFKRLFEACLVIWIDAAALISGVDLFNTYLLTYLLTYILTY